MRTGSLRWQAPSSDAGERTGRPERHGAAGATSCTEVAITQPQPIRILIASDRLFTAAGLESLVDGQADMRVVANAATVTQAVDLYERHRPNVTFIDFRAPEPASMAIRNIRARDGTARIVAVAADNRAAYQVLQAGARSCLNENVDCEYLWSTIRAVYSGRRSVSPATLAGAFDHASQDQLTPRERDVLVEVMRGLSNREVAHTLGIAVGTVKNHVYSILSKLGAQSRTQAATLALERSLVRLDEITPGEIQRGGPV
jgi:two-component system, NarL family, response regulator